MSRARHAGPRRRMTGRTEHVTGWLACAAIVTAGVLGVAPPAFAAEDGLTSLPEPPTSNPPVGFVQMSQDGSDWQDYPPDLQIVNWAYDNGDPITWGVVPDDVPVVGSIWVRSTFCTSLLFHPPVHFDDLPDGAVVEKVEIDDGTSWTQLVGDQVDGYNFPTSATELNNVGITVPQGITGGELRIRITFGDVPTAGEGLAPVLDPYLDCRVPVPTLGDTTSVARGATLPVTGTGFTPGEEFVVSAGSGLETEVTAEGDGSITGEIEIPAATELGSYSLTATDPVTGLVATWDFEVTDVTPTPTVTVTITETATVPGPTVTVTETVPGPTVTETVTAPPEPAPTVTVTTTPAPGQTVTVTAAPPAGSWSTGGTSRGSTSTGTTPSRGPLAETGANVGQLAMLAVGAVLAGTWLTLRTRRRLYEP